METLPAVSPEGARHNAAHNCLQLSFEVNIGTEQDHWKGETRGGRREGKKAELRIFHARTWSRTFSEENNRMSYSQPNRPCSTTGGRECASEGVLRVSAKVAIEELQKNCELDRHGDKGESDAHAAHIQSANRTARRYDTSHVHIIRIP